MSLSELKKLEEKIKLLEDRQGHIAKDMELLKQVFAQIRERFDFIRDDLAARHHKK